MEVSRKLHNPTNLLWGKSPQFPFDRTVGTAHGQSGCSGEEKTSLPLLEIKPQLSSGSQTVHRDTLGRCRITLGEAAIKH
jgi:hypothetical protein